VNRSTDEFTTIQIAAAGVQIKSVKSAELVTGPSAAARNTFDKPNTICNQKLSKIKLDEEKAIIQLPPLSVAAISFHIDDKP
jgi:alpha-L-arabinofuranosidase